MRRAAALAIVAAAALGAGTAIGPPGLRAAQTSPARLALAAVPAWAPLGSDLHVDLRVEPVTPGVEVVLAVKERLASRSAFDRTLDGGALGDTVSSITVPLDDLGPGPGGTTRISANLGPPPAAEAAPDAAGGGEPEAGAAGAESAPALPSLPVTQEGVYPLLVELRVAASSTLADSLTTYLVTLDPASQRTTLDVSWVWPVAQDAPLRPDGAVSRGLRDAVSPGGPIVQITDALAAVPDVPVTVAPRAATLEAWAEVAATSAGGAAPATPATTTANAQLAAERLEAFRHQAGLATRQVLAGTYARVDLPGLARAGLTGEIASQLAEGADVLGTALRIRPDPRTYFAGGPLDGRALAALRRAGVDRLVVPRGAVVPVFEQLTPARPFEVEGGGRTFLTAAADPVLSGLLAPRDDDPAPSDAEVVQQVMAGLAVVALEAPGEQRGVVLVPPTDWRPSSNLLVGALQGVVGHPALEPVTLDDFFSSVPVAEGEAGARRFEPVEPDTLAISATDVRRARARIASMAGMLTDDAREPVMAGRRLLLAEAEPFQSRRARPRASEYVDGVEAIIASVLGAIRLPDAPAVTLTAPRARVPITFVNDSGGPLRVRVHLSSDKLLFPGGDAHDLELPPRGTTERFAIEARTSGTFPMLVELTSPDGGLVVGSFEMTIRNTAVSGVALTITVGAGVFLVGWWGNHVRKARRARRADEAADADALPTTDR